MRQNRRAMILSYDDSVAYPAIPCPALPSLYGEHQRRASTASINGEHPETSPGRSLVVRPHTLGPNTKKRPGDNPGR